MTRALALLLCLACATASASAEEPVRDRGPVRSAVVLFPDGPATVEGGVWASDKAIVATGEELAQLRTQNALLTAGLILAGVVAVGAVGWAAHASLTGGGR